MDIFLKKEPIRNIDFGSLPNYTYFINLSDMDEPASEWTIYYKVLKIMGPDETQGNAICINHLPRLHTFLLNVQVVAIEVESLTVEYQRPF